MLYADDMVILADDEEMFRRALNEMGEWCEEWLMKVNVDKRGIMLDKQRGDEHEAEICHKWRVDTECG